MNIRIRQSVAVIILAALLVLTASAQQGTAPTIHVVQRGENLFQIARSYGLTIQDVAVANGLTNPGNIQVGQRLLIPLPNGETLPGTHVVQAGETLGSIATLYGVMPDVIVSNNAIANPNDLYVGQVLIISPSVPISFEELDGAPEISAPLIVPEGSSPQPVEQPPVVAAVPPEVSNIAPSVIIHTVLQGETLFRIAQQYGVEVNAIIQANAIVDPSLIYAGQELVIPGVQAPEIALDLPAPVTNIQLMPLVFIEGQTGMIRLFTNAPVSFSGTFQERPLSFASESEGTRHTALVGIPVGTTSGVYPISFTVTDFAGASASMTINVQVVSGGYGVETLTLIDDRTGLLDPAVEEGELSILRNYMSVFDPVRLFDGAMGLPAAATITSPFGSTRAYNGGATRVHAGTDFAGVPGTPILAPADGRVVLADTLNVRGVATVIDHGWGVYSGYWHQTDRYVGIGETVTAGQVIGTIGSTGRVSGPHLHWELWVNGVPVDPMQWVILDFS